MGHFQGARVCKWRVSRTAVHQRLAIDPVGTVSGLLLFDDVSGCGEILARLRKLLHLFLHVCCRSDTTHLVVGANDALAVPKAGAAGSGVIIDDTYEVLLEEYMIVPTVPLESP